MQIIPINTQLGNFYSRIYGDTDPFHIGLASYIVDFKIELQPGDPVAQITSLELSGVTGSDWVITEINGQPYQYPLPAPININFSSPVFFKAQMSNWVVGATPPTNFNQFISNQFVVYYTNVNGSSGFASPIRLWEVIDVDEPTTDPLYGLGLSVGTLNAYPCFSSGGCNNDIAFEFDVKNESAVYFPIELNLLTGTGQITNPVYYLDGVPVTGNIVNLPPWPYQGKIGIGFCSDSQQTCSLEIFPGTQASQFATRRVDIVTDPLFCPPVGSNGLDCINLVLKSENGSFGYPAISDSISYCDSDCSPVPNGYNTASVGEEKYLVHTLHYVHGFSGGGVQIWYNPSLYEQYCDVSAKYGGPIDTPPQDGYYYNIPNSIIGDGNYYDMIQFSIGLPASIASNKNWRVQIKILTNTTFEIKHTFYLWADLDNWITNSVFTNNDKLLYSDAITQTKLITQGTVYSQWKSICSFIFIKDPNIQITYQGIKQDFFVHLEKCIPITIRHWNSGLFYNNYVAEFTNPEFILERGNSQVNNFSNVSRTKVTFRITNPTGAFVDSAVFWLWKRNTNDDNSNFFTSTDSSRALILDDPTVQTINNHLESPSLKPFSIGGNRYECSCYVDNNLQPGEQYILGVIVFSENDQIVNSFFPNRSYGIDSTVDISDLCCPLDITPQWYDLFNRYLSSNECITPILKERIGHSLGIEVGDLQNCLDGLGIGAPWYSFLTDIKLNIYRQENYYPGNPPSIPAQDILVMYEQYQSLYNQSAQGSFINQSPDFIVSYDSINNRIRTNWVGRVRYEDSLIPQSAQCFFIDPANPMIRNIAGAGATTWIQQNNITYNWADKDIWFEYVFTFDFSSYFGSPTTISFVYRPRIHPMDYETNPSPWASLLASITFTGYIGATSEIINTNLPICIDKYDYIEVEVMDNGDGLVGEFIAFIDKSPYGINNLIEGDEPATNPTYLPVLTNSAIFNISDFNSKGNFSFYPSLLGPGKYQICGAYIELT